MSESQKALDIARPFYRYPRRINSGSFGQASPELLIGVNAFTRPEPFEKKPLQTLIAEMLKKMGREELINQFGLEDFSINVLSVKRTLVEKIFGVIRDSYHDDPVTRLSIRIRHLYDICLIMQENEFRKFMHSKEFEELCHFCIEDEKAGFFGNSDYMNKPLHEAPIFSHFQDWEPSLKSIYRGDFSSLVYGELPEMKSIAEVLQLLHKRLHSESL